VKTILKNRIIAIITLLRGLHIKALALFQGFLLCHHRKKSLRCIITRNIQSVMTNILISAPPKSYSLVLVAIHIVNGGLDVDEEGLLALDTNGVFFPCLHAIKIAALTHSKQHNLLSACGISGRHT
jgi:hypothetical protein